MSAPGPGREPGWTGATGPASRRQKHELSGDARLQFWRDTYLVALAARLEHAPPTVAYDRHQLTVASDAAATLADLATTAHLLRCQPGVLDDIVDATSLLIQGHTSGGQGR
jgi:hypothetical protein